MKYLADFKARFDPVFFSHIRSGISEVSGYISDFGPVGDHLIELLRHGKRLRPYVAELSYRSAGGEDSSPITQALCALELFQAFALIHDDIMDHARSRRGVETMHVRFDLNRAILAGDLCLAWAFKALVDCPKTTRPILSIFNKLSAETIIGQMIDISLRKRRGVEEKLLDFSVELKSARYTFIYPTMLGLNLAGSSEITYRYKTVCGYLGHAFQRLNDLADVMRDQPELGRLPGSDVSEDVPTHLSHHFDRHASDGQKAIYAVYRGQPLDRSDIERIRELFTLSGSVKHEQKAIASYLDRAENLIKEPDFILAKAKQAGVCREEWLNLLGSMRSQLNMI